MDRAAKWWGSETARASSRLSSDILKAYVLLSVAPWMGEEGEARGFSPADTFLDK